MLAHQYSLSKEAHNSIRSVCRAGLFTRCMTLSAAHLSAAHVLAAQLSAAAAAAAAAAPQLDLWLCITTCDSFPEDHYDLAGNLWNHLL